MLLAIAAAGVAALLRDEPALDCGGHAHEAESDPTLIGLDTAKGTSCEEAARVVARAEQALSDAGADFERLDGMRVRTDAGEQCDVSFEYEFQWEIVCRRGDAVVTGRILN